MYFFENPREKQNRAEEDEAIHEAEEGEEEAGRKETPWPIGPRGRQSVAATTE